MTHFLLINGILWSTSFRIVSESILNPDWVVQPIHKVYVVTTLRWYKYQHHFSVHIIYSCQHLSFLINIHGYKKCTVNNNTSEKLDESCSTIRYNCPKCSENFLSFFVASKLYAIIFVVLRIQHKILKFSSVETTFAQ